MARRKKEKVIGRYFTWLIGHRNGVWYADGRSNRPPLGRHSLGTRDRTVAVRELAELDLRMAADRGLADPAALAPSGADELSLDEGRQLYLAHAARPRVAGGIRPVSAKRYQAVFDKFLPFARSRGVTAWNRVTARTLSDYASHLDEREYAHRTQYLELTTIKQAVGWLVAQKHLPADCRLVFELEKPTGTDTYCWTRAEVLAILEHCRGRADLVWLGDLLATLAFTGMRISEAISLRWSDVDLALGTLHLTDESASTRRRGREARTLKGGAGRVVNFNEELRPILERMAHHPDGFVFHGPSGGRLKADTVRRALIRDVLGPLSERFPTPPGEIGFRDGRLHSFRHFFASLCANRGVSQRVVMRWLGHKDSRMVEHYYHLHDEESRRQMSRVRLADEGPDAGR